MRTTTTMILAAAALVLGGAATVTEAVTVQWTVAEGGNGHLYEAVLVPSGIYWADAKAAAEGAGGYLATITSPEENAFVYGLASANAALWNVKPNGDSLGPWLGGYQAEGSLEPAGGWRWVTNEPWQFTNWAPFEPNNTYGTEDRLQLFGFQTAKGSAWNDFRQADPLFPVYGYVVETIPEPATLSLLALGALAALRKRRK